MLPSPYVQSPCFPVINVVRRFEVQPSSTVNVAVSPIPPPPLDALRSLCATPHPLLASIVMASRGEGDGAMAMEECMRRIWPRLRLVLFLCEPSQGGAGSLLAPSAASASRTSSPLSCTPSFFPCESGANGPCGSGASSSMRAASNHPSATPRAGVYKAMRVESQGGEGKPRVPVVVPSLFTPQPWPQPSRHMYDIRVNQKFLDTASLPSGCTMRMAAAKSLCPLDLTPFAFQQLGGSASGGAAAAANSAAAFDIPFPRPSGPAPRLHGGAPSLILSIASNNAQFSGQILLAWCLFATEAEVVSAAKRQLLGDFGAEATAWCAGSPLGSAGDTPGALPQLGRAGGHPLYPGVVDGVADAGDDLCGGFGEDLDLESGWAGMPNMEDEEDNLRRSQSPPLAAAEIVSSPGCPEGGKRTLEAEGGNGSDDADVLEGDAIVSLRCPLSYARIQLAVKGRRCTHAAAFDLSTYIHSCVRHSSWNCPVCDEAVFLADLVVDATLQDALARTASVPLEVEDKVYVFGCGKDQWRRLTNVSRSVSGSPSRSSSDDHEEFGAPSAGGPATTAGPPTQSAHASPAPRSRSISDASPGAPVHDVVCCDSDGDL